MKKRIEDLESKQPKDSKKDVISLGQKWLKAMSEGDKAAAEQARKGAGLIFKDHPELRNGRKLRMELALYIQWHNFVASPYKEKLVAAFENWKQAHADKKQALAEQANTLYLELTGQEIPSTPLFGEDDSFEQFWETGTRYDEKLQKLRSEYGN